MEPKFQFYEIVRVTKPEHQSKEYEGKEGAVLGRLQNDQQKWRYGVSLYGFDESVMFAEDELESTGRFGKREGFYSGESIKVWVDPETGEGYLADE